ncbi:hypothetical protein COCON_G00046140 [Conger conger]|uniref:Uncharacterized protein n=1 Tax=Conger conger TaxID=82655 RepID=A0A9Q1DUL1_CONCO|nr:hypothetical protein COCON_G00046140 [Conger conger]
MSPLDVRRSTEHRLCSFWSPAKKKYYSKHRKHLKLAEDRKYFGLDINDRVSRLGRHLSRLLWFMRSRSPY